jgi:pSer/pThr/pTyr-binding forkhead associated (FHA) protein
VGSLPQNDIVLDQPGVSRRHAVLIPAEGELWVQDLASTQGVSVDGVRIRQRQLLDGVHAVRFGPCTLQVATRSDLLV